MRLLSRREALRSLSLAAFHIMFPWRLDLFNTAKSKSMLPQELYLESLIGTNHSRAGHEFYEFKVGDHISFCPHVMIDHCTKSPPPKQAILEHLICGIYEFHFRPLREYIDHGLTSRDYVIEVAPGLTMYHLSWLHKDRLTVGQWYRAYGRLGSCLDPLEFNPIAEPNRIKDLRQDARIEQILIDPLAWRDLVGMGYLHDWSRFRQELRGYRYQPREVESTEAWKAGTWLTYRVRLKQRKPWLSWGCHWGL